MDLKPVVLAVAVIAGARVASTAPLRFIEDNYTKAVAEAKTKKVPIFVEAWAPW